MDTKYCLLSSLYCCIGLIQSYFVNMKTVLNSLCLPSDPAASNTRPRSVREWTVIVTVDQTETPHTTAPRWGRSIHVQNLCSPSECCPRRRSRQPCRQVTLSLCWRGSRDQTGWRCESPSERPIRWWCSRCNQRKADDLQVCGRTDGRGSMRNRKGSSQE